MKNYFTIFIAILLGIMLTACMKKDKPQETTRENTTETTENSDAEGSENTSASDESGSDEITDIKYGVSNIPSTLKGYKGKPVAAATWIDANGENVIVITETAVSERPGEYDNLQSKELYGYHFIMKGDKSEELWKIQDFVRDCEFDLRLTYVPESLTITDLDDDGIAESTFLYNMSCKSDVSPDNLKLMMHENENKYALRGYTYIKAVDAGGDYKVDAAFNDAPSSFLDYAKQQWKKHKNFEY